MLLKKKNRKQKWKMPHLLTLLDRQTLCFSSYKNHKLKFFTVYFVGRKRFNPIQDGHFQG